MLRTLSFLVCFGFFFLALGIVGCGGGGGGGEDSELGGGACNSLSAKLASGNQQIFNGDTCNQFARTPVVAIYPIAQNGEQLETGGICTGTLVTVDDILTSAHCFTEPLTRLGDALVAFAVVVGGAGGEVILLSSFATHPFYDGNSGSRFDIAMATLSAVPSPPIGPLPLLLSQLSLPGQNFSVFGYGTNNEGQIGVLKSAEFQIADIQNGNLLSTFQGSNSVSVCGGDSGGPAVQVVNGVTTLIGVNSFGVILGGLQCPVLPAIVSGFVDIQNDDILEFISSYAPDVAAN